MSKFPIAVLLIGSLALVGCTRSSNALRVDTRAQPLPSSPSGNLQAGQLPPAGAQGQVYAQGQQQPYGNQTTQPNLQAPTVLGGANQNTEVASLTPEQSAAEAAKPISHEIMAGSWNAMTDNPECRVILSFTKWSGGYRAATRRCNAPELSGVSAWDIKDNKVVLIDRNGTQVASLAGAGKERFVGQLASGNPVSFSR